MRRALRIAARAGLVDSADRLAHAPPAPRGRAVPAGNAAAVFVNTFNTVNARIGDRSIVPPTGGMIPRNKFRYGSHSVASGYTICLGGLGNHVRMRRPMSSVL